MTRSNILRRFSKYFSLAVCRAMFFGFLWFLFCFTGKVHAWDATAYNAGKTLGSEMDAKLGSTDAIKKRISNPMTSEETSMRTLNDQKTFGSQISAPSSKSFLYVLIQPSGTGDITSLFIRQDTNFDGAPDYTYRVSSPLSGICSNGFISANPGTWNQKRFYTWTADTNGKLSASEVPSMMSLAGCYCINSSCGSNLVWNNIGLVLRDLGGGMASAIHQKKPFTITDVNVLETEIRYYGQASNQMGNIAGIPSSGVSNPEQYYQNGTGTLPGEEEALKQSRDPGSLYSQINVLNNNVGNQYETRSCFLKRQVHLVPQTEIIGYDVGFYIGYDANGDTKECFWAAVSGDCKDVWAMDSGWASCQSLNVSNLGAIVHGIIAGGACIPYTDPVSGQTGCFSPPGTINIRSYQFIQQTGSGYSPGCYGSSDDSTHQYWHVKAYVVDDPNSWKQTLQGKLIVGVRDYPQKTQTDDCGSMDLTGCQKRDEKICDHNNSGCIYTFQDYHATGLIPIGSCFNQTSPNTGDTWTFCADGVKLSYESRTNTGNLEYGSDIWWYIHRTYTCEAGNLYDFTNMRRRAANIQNTLNTGTNKLSYQDLNPVTGRTTPVATSLPPREDVSRCEQSCQVKIPVQDTQASLSGTTDDYRTTVNSYEVAIRKCVNNACPTKRGEILIQNCGCINYFNQAASTLQVAHDAGRDMICSNE
ncbi:MAG: hypothetical protein C4518_04855 [Desulfobacteraceae bacterium]|nr:MAG: hypothetical protein C4518_04855 [Desulfobacteraceae bacterium]